MLNYIEDENTVTDEEWVKVADAGQDYLFQIETFGERILKVKSFSSPQTIANISKTGGTLLGYEESFTQDNFNGYVYVLGNKSVVKYNLHRDE